MRYFKEIQLPEYCFLSELVEWVAFGRVPEIHYQFEVNEPGYADHRFFDEVGAQVEYNDVCHLYAKPYLHFSASEVQSLGNDPVEYENAYRACRGSINYAEDTARLLQHIESDPFIRQEIKERSQQLFPELIERAKAALPLFEEIKSKSEARLADAWGVAFGAIKSESLSLQGVNSLAWQLAVDAALERAEQSGASKYIPVQITDHVPFEAIGPSAVNYNTCWIGNIVEGDPEYLSARVKTSDALELKSLVPASSINGQQRGDFAFIGTKGGKIAKRKKGRPPAADYSVIEADLYSELVQGNIPPGTNPDSLAHYVVSRHRKPNGDPIGHSTIKQNMDEVLKAVCEDANKRGENVGEKSGEKGD